MKLKVVFVVCAVLVLLASLACFVMAQRIVANAETNEDIDDGIVWMTVGAICIMLVPGLLRYAVYYARTCGLCMHLVGLHRVGVCASPGCLCLAPPWVGA